MVKVESRWENYTLTGFVSKPTDARPSRALQTFFVNNRPVKSRLLISALEEAYRNQIMVGKFPACVLHLTLPANTVDVNVHPAKTEVKFLSEKAVFDCVHYGVLGALNKQTDRPQVQFKQAPAAKEPGPGSLTEGAGMTKAMTRGVSQTGKATPSAPSGHLPQRGRQENFFRTMTPEEFKTFSAAVQNAPQPRKEAAAAAATKIERPAANMPLREFVMVPGVTESAIPVPSVIKAPENKLPEMPVVSQAPAAPSVPESPEEPEQIAMEMPMEIPWRMVGELYNSYILVEQGEEVFLIDKHAAHERILFEKLKANQEEISSQTLLTPIPVRLSPAAAGELLANTAMLEELGFEIEEFGENTVLLRQIPMDLSPEDAADAVETLASDLLSGRRERKDTVRDELLHTVACKAAIKAGWKNDEAELLAVAKQVMAREDLKYCPHGRPICITLSKKQLEKQFKRT